MTSKRKLQVFVSSTFTDLKLERQAAVEAILKAGHIPAGMELFAAGNESQMQTIRRWIDESDIYMLILGGRYGSVESASSLSYTELEYDYAMSQQKPLFSVVIHDAALNERVKAMGRDVIETERAKELDLFRTKVLSFTSSFFADAKDIKLAVHETLGDFQARFRFVGWVPGNEAQDIGPLLDELSSLRGERDALKTQLTTMETAAARAAPKLASKWADAELQDIVNVLEKVEISTKLFNVENDDEEKKIPVMRILSVVRDLLITGVSNQHDMSNLDQLYFFNVFPKLEMYDLAILEKVAGVRWQRYRLSPKGRALLVYFDKCQSKVSQNT